MHLLIHALEDGELPVYDFDFPYYYMWCGEDHRVERPESFGRGHWEVKKYASRAIINLDWDWPLTLLVDQLSDIIRSLPEHEDGTLILALRSVYSVNFTGEIIDCAQCRIVDRHDGVFVMGGIAFVEGQQRGTNLEGVDLTYLVEQTCLLVAGKEYDRSTPGLEEWRIGVEDAKRSKQERRNQVLAKARAVLTLHLDEDQLAEFEKSGEFHVSGADGYTYLITEKKQHNVYRIEDGRRTVEYCIVTKNNVPIHDQMLAQMLLLMANPTMFHEITNAWTLSENGERTIVHHSSDPAGWFQI